MSIMDKQQRTKVIMNPMGHFEKKFDTMTTRALDETDFEKLMELLEK